MEIGKNIKKYRTAKHLTQQQLATALFVSPQAISRWETGASYPDITILPELAKVLGISTDTLLGCGQAVTASASEKTVHRHKTKNRSY